MLELGSLVKSFVLAVVVMLALQVRLGSHTAEAHLNDWLRTSSATAYLQEVAAGAVVVIDQTLTTAKSFISENLGQKDNTQKASRLNIKLQRSEQYNDN